MHERIHQCLAKRLFGEIRHTHAFRTVGKFPLDVADPKPRKALLKGSKQRQPQLVMVDHVAAADCLENRTTGRKEAMKAYGSLSFGKLKPARTPMRPIRLSKSSCSILTPSELRKSSPMMRPQVTSTCGSTKAPPASSK